MDNASQPAKGSSTTPPLDPVDAQEADLTGQMLGEFRLLHRIGRGGMGQVYLAEQISLKRKVALKLLHGEMAGNERSLLRFKAEAENVARATHANIVQIYTIGQTNGINYIALEYVDGKNLREFIERKGTPELSLGLHVMAQVAAALQRASELGVIHRDVKPENIMLTKKGEVKVADFGLSRCYDEANPQHLTQSQVVMGTPLYMSPEQVERRPIDSRTDIYSFGVTCYHMFAGHPPFRGNSPIDVAYQHVHQEPQDLGEIRPDLPAELRRIIHKMMAKKPEERYQTAREIARDISRLRDTLNLGAIAAISMSATFLGAAPDALSGSATQAYVAPKSWWLRTMIVVSVLAALGGSLLFGWYQHNAAHRDPPPDDLAPIKIALNASEREQELKKLVQQYAQSEIPREQSTGLTHAIELARFYFQERKYAEADRFFEDLRKPERKGTYRMLGRIGHAAVLAFKDDYAQSNKEFGEIIGQMEKIERIVSGRIKFEKPPLPKDEIATLKKKSEAYKQLWKEPWEVREMVAQALNYNYTNAPAEFPKALDPYRFPPRPTLNPPPP